MRVSKALYLEASKGGTKVGRMKDPLYMDSYLGITPPTFILPFEAPDILAIQKGSSLSEWSPGVGSGSPQPVASRVPSKALYLGGCRGPGTQTDGFRV